MHVFTSEDLQNIASKTIFEVYIIIINIIFIYHLANRHTSYTKPISHHMVYKYHQDNNLEVLKGHSKMCFCNNDSKEKPSVERWDLV